MAFQGNMNKVSMSIDIGEEERILSPCRKVVVEKIVEMFCERYCVKHRKIGTGKL